jgi:3-oxoacyl-[acyl-carrier-protein] synthase-3
MRRAGKRPCHGGFFNGGGGVTEAASDVLRKLTIVFAELEQRLEGAPLLRKLSRGKFSIADYQALLVNLRQQVKNGALWMSRAASNISEPHLELRSMIMRHAVTEHRD